MDFKEELEALGRRCQSQGASMMGNEQATKNALVLPFIQALGYNIFDVTEVVPEYSAAIGEHKDARVDYAILKDGEPIIIIECKALGSELKASQCNQLLLYFVGTEAKIAILTDGERYMFFSGLEESQKMDTNPYMEFSISKIDETLVAELKKLTKSAFDPHDAISSANDLKYTRAFKKIFNNQLTNPDEDFLKFFLKSKIGDNKVYKGTVTQKVIEQLTPVLKQALNQYIKEAVNQRLNDAMDRDDEKPTNAPPELPAEPEDDGIVTTEDEWAAYYIVKAILAGTVDDVARVQLNDYKTCCNICLDKKQQYLVRLYFNKKPYAIELFDTATDDDRKEKIPVERPDDLYQFADRIKATAQAILSK